MPAPRRPQPWPSGIAHGLTKLQRDVLIAHVRGPQLFIAAHKYTPTTIGLMSKGLIHGFGMIKPHHTTLTVLGREVVCIVLGDYADRLLLEKDYEDRLLPKPRRARKCPMNGHAVPVISDG